MKQTQTYSTTSLALAAALSSLGIPFHSEIPFVKSRSTKGDHFTFIFEAASPDGKYRAADLAKAWDNEAWHAENPEHPLAFLKAGFTNRETLLDVMKQGAGLVMIEKAGRIAVLSENASPALQTQIFQKL